MNPRRKKRLTIVTSIIIGLGVVAGLVLYALSQNIDLFYKPSEIYNGKQDTGLKAINGQRLRIGGLVVPGSVHRNSESLKVSFKLADMRMPISFSETDPTVTVSYDGILPDLFREGQGIVANGILVNGNVIEASEVLAKHDENYMPRELLDDATEKPVNSSYSKNLLETTY
ncbi:MULTISPECIES: cytochrome c maturation protein CcmE [unclassified Colwellia]|jgi:cytochrome c-type biogenesis protein CcmE|uniref:cytochrome c maturation protein CcmE n=1 Tax=unclassified Colwellia TaxID=196834 RepID=UPI0015F4480E|nr:MULTISPECIES: cytochrome c maturation protein CcmE [unclassified Colwellia]MBA6222928.1 cytochrome c maturation protein CcmE [Colwellia sp. MB3u-45]MBA6267760.1 cytochrome c maturation protein CcmE [Colwellia sp. MB3u-43]MBA6288172.1 cytochrome c maturation protein CcmE [Colwellia sp. MB3u-4]MBA6293482.1 cytochrome c maturation protein CcmE [Colwellia sp. MB3u-8]MBA6297528.1 cytochrome c maturation protein CcmE [Colwellia sp. MB02u-9]